MSAFFFHTYKRKFLRDEGEISVLHSFELKCLPYLLPSHVWTTHVHVAQSNARYGRMLLITRRQIKRPAPPWVVLSQVRELHLGVRGERQPTIEDWGGLGSAIAAAENARQRDGETVGQPLPLIRVSNPWNGKQRRR